jgi:protein-tyrosine phosphatase
MTSDPPPEISSSPWSPPGAGAPAGHPRAQVTLLGLWCSTPRPVLADPYGLSDAYFDTCFGCIDEAVETLVRTVERRRAQR